MKTNSSLQPITPTLTMTGCSLLVAGSHQLAAERAPSPDTTSLPGGFSLYDAFPSESQAAQYAADYQSQGLGKAKVVDLGEGAGRLRWAIFVTETRKRMASGPERDPELSSLCVALREAGFASFASSLEATARDYMRGRCNHSVLETAIARGKMKLQDAGKLSALIPTPAAASMTGRTMLAWASDFKVGDAVEYHDNNGDIRAGVLVKIEGDYWTVKDAKTGKTEKMHRTSVRKPY
jgi:hypothetical protein